MGADDDYRALLSKFVGIAPAIKGRICPTSNDTNADPSKVDFMNVRMRANIILALEEDTPRPPCPKLRS